MNNFFRPAFSARFLWPTLLATLIVALFAIRLAGPSDLENDAQHRNVAYVMDAVWQGNWLVQQDIQGRIMSKPPLHTWAAAAFAEFAGINRLTLALPSLLAVLAMAWAVSAAGFRHFGKHAGLFAGFALALAPIMAKHIALVRTDALFSFAISMAAFSAFRAWEKRSGWTAFWVWSACATLIKGPLGLVLAAMGLLAWFWERRSHAVAPLAGSHRMGIALYLLIVLGWLLPALLSAGQALFDKLFLQELVGQAAGIYKESLPGSHFPKPTLFFIVRFFPFSLLVLVALWRIIRTPALSAAERRFERFLFCWIVGGLFLFSLASHHRADLLLPLWPASALLAGRELARWNLRLAAPLIALLSCLTLAGSWWNYHHRAGHDKALGEIQRTIEAAQALAASGLDVRRIHHLDTPVTLQLELGTFHPWISAAEALRLSRASASALFAVASPDNYPELFGVAGVAQTRVFRWPPGEEAEAEIQIYSNAASLSDLTRDERLAR